ncbi:hypothetical protein Mycch_0071 [Mycolicibacterium chubuense NBB4]|uniref:Uncharacterized protein n=1 Tax=Mycolicibacterium chubuense (strain NBB4) TaxID=710421 RepID=I4BC92_MYCCN|nr:hypothetical protein Mycch_0071 [Mycolicibacterium chubuense NBB4]
MTSVARGGGAAAACVRCGGGATGIGGGVTSPRGEPPCGFSVSRPEGGASRSGSSSTVRTASGEWKAPVQLVADLPWDGHDPVVGRVEDTGPDLRRAVGSTGVPFVGGDLDPAVRVPGRFGVDLGRRRRQTVVRELVSRADVGEFRGDSGQGLDIRWCGVTDDHVHHRCDPDLRSHTLQHQHFLIARGDDMTVPLTAHHKADHFATAVPAPPPAVERAVRPAQRVDHRGDLGMRIAERGEDSLGGEVASDLVPDDLALLFVGDVGADAERQRKVDQVEQVRDDQHAVDGDLDPHHVVVVGGFGVVEEGARRHGRRRRPRSAPDSWSVSS